MFSYPPATSLTRPLPAEYSEVTDPACLITHMPARSITLLQIHTADVDRVAPLAGRAFDEPVAGFATYRGPRAYALAPTEWLLIDYPRDRMRRSLEEFGDLPVRLTDVSAAFSCMQIEGSAARAVLATDIGASWMASSARPGNYVRTRLGQVEVVLQCTGDCSFELHVDRSVAAHLEQWLTAQFEMHFPSGGSQFQ